MSLCRIFIQITFRILSRCYMLARGRGETLVRPICIFMVLQACNALSMASEISLVNLLCNNLYTMFWCMKFMVIDFQLVNLILTLSVCLLPGIMVCASHGAIEAMPLQ